LREKSYWMSDTNGMLQGLTSGLVDQRESRAPLFILHPGAVLLILVPMLHFPNTQLIYYYIKRLHFSWSYLVLIGGIGGCENDLALTNGEREIGRSFGDNPHCGFGVETGVNLVADVGHGGWSVVRREMRGVVVGLVSHVVDGGGGSRRGVIACSGSRGVPVGEPVIGFIMMMMVVMRRGSWIVEVLRHVSRWRHVRGVEHVGLGLRGAVEGWGWLVGEGVSRRRVNGGSFVVVVVSAVVGVAEGVRHGWFCVLESEERKECLVVKLSLADTIEVGNGILNTVGRAHRPGPPPQINLKFNKIALVVGYVAPFRLVWTDYPFCNFRQLCHQTLILKVKYLRRATCVIHHFFILDGEFL